LSEIIISGIPCLPNMDFMAEMALLAVADNNLATSINLE